MEKGNVGADEFPMAHLLEEGVRLINSHWNGFADGVSAAGRFCISIVQRRKAQDQEGMHPRNAFDVTVSILQRNLARVDEWHSCRPESQRHFAAGSVELKPVMSEWTAVRCAKLQGRDLVRVFDDQGWVGL